MKNRINVGDKVNIFFEHVPAIFEGTVLNTPSDIEHVWIIRDQHHRLLYVKTFTVMELIEENKDSILTK